jgi:sulfite exporter TauE/SafE
MLTSITPLGERGRHRRWASTATWYVIGSTLGGLAIGALAGLIGAGLAQLDLSPSVWLIAAAAVCLVAAGWDSSGSRPPSWKRQVDETWLPRYRGWVIGGGFGAQLGFGVVTIVSSTSVYAALLLAALTTSFWGGLAIGATFGLARALPLLTVRGVQTNEALAALHRRVGTMAPLVRRSTVGVLGLAAAVLVATALVTGS